MLAAVRGLVVGALVLARTPDPVLSARSLARNTPSATAVLGDQYMYHRRHAFDVDQLGPVVSTRSVVVLLI